MHVEQRCIHLIKPYEKNPRLNDAAVDRVAESIRQFGFRQPIVVDAAGVIVVGHTRYLAALKLELETIPVHVAAELTAAQAAAYRIADNKLGELAQWDLELLSSELAALEALDFDLDVLGFEDDELAQLLGEEIQTGLTDPDQIPDPPDKAVTQPGDLWLLGEHQQDLRRRLWDHLLDGLAKNKTTRRVANKLKEQIQL